MSISAVVVFFSLSVFFVGSRLLVKTGSELPIDDEKRPRLTRFTATTPSAYDEVSRLELAKQILDSARRELEEPRERLEVHEARLRAVSGEVQDEREQDSRGKTQAIAVWHVGLAEEHDVWHLA